MLKNFKDKEITNLKIIVGGSSNDPDIEKDKVKQPPPGGNTV